MTDPTPDQLREIEEAVDRHVDFDPEQDATLDDKVKFCTELVGTRHDDKLFAFQNTFRPDGDQEDWESNRTRDSLAAAKLLDDPETQAVLEHIKDTSCRIHDYTIDRFRSELDRVMKKAELKGDLKAYKDLLKLRGDLEGFFTQKVEVMHRNESLEEKMARARSLVAQNPAIIKQISPKALEMIGMKQDEPEAEDAEYEVHDGQ